MDMQIIVATDLSPASDNSIDLAKALARGVGDSLYLVHAFHMKMAAYGDAMTAMPAIIDDARQAASKQLAEMVAELSGTEAPKPAGRKTRHPMSASHMRATAVARVGWW
jgi:nucleotide-binding universal stress UspA family protein